jgi:hypothetical protein
MLGLLERHLSETAPPAAIDRMERRAALETN